MNAKEVRDALVEGLYGHLGGIPVYRSGQARPEEGFPYVAYSVTATNRGSGTIGHYEVAGAGEDAEEIRREQASMSLSFTACSQNRGDGTGATIYGEDEAQEVAERAHGWFAHAGYDYFMGKGVVISDVTEIQGRNMLMVDEEVNRKGFDVICSYISEDRRKVGAVRKASIRRGKGGRG